MPQRTITDWHTHVWLPEHLGPEWGADLDALYPQIPSSSASLDQHSAAMERLGANAAVVIALVSDYFGLAIPNEYVAECVSRSPVEAIGVASVDPNRSSAPKELEYAVRELGMRGLKLAPPYQNFHPHSPEAYAVYAAAERLGVFIIFHQGAVSHRRGVLEVANPVLLDRVMRDFPRLRVIIAHVGQPWFTEVIALMRKHRTLYSDLSARCSRSWQLYGILQSALDYGVTGRLLWGSDFPVFEPAAHLGDLLKLNERIGEHNRPIPMEVLESIAYDRPLDLIV